ncbi:unnamed protein product [Staurois parvus]|uniref:Uncharacterized protein n=1 Tax=Staurois parvus TaxID=386267 RepID=A0ABN9F5K7_9NEOB|nr:unnamed protein product [Staurois parvus]
MAPPTDPGPSGSARVSKWSVRPCSSPLVSFVALRWTLSSSSTSFLRTGV